MTGFSVVVKAVIRDRAQNLCEVCGQYTSDCVAHHRRPRGLGGSRRDDTNGAANALWVCAADHNRIESYRAQAYDNGWLVRQSASPAAVPVLRRGAWVLLSDDGSVSVVPSVEEDEQQLGFRTW